MKVPLIHQRIDAAERGENLTVISRMNSGWLVACDKQTPRGWCILIRTPIVDCLEDLQSAEQALFLADMASVGVVLKQVTGAHRINYSIFGNTDPVLHAHIQPRFSEEPDHLRSQPLWAIWQHLESVPFDLQRDRPWMEQIHAGVIRAQAIGNDPPRKKTTE